MFRFFETNVVTEQLGLRFQFVISILSILPWQVKSVPGFQALVQKGQIFVRWCFAATASILP